MTSSQVSVAEKSGKLPEQTSFISRDTLEQKAIALSHTILQKDLFPDDQTRVSYRTTLA